MDLIIIGYSGHAYVAIDIFRADEVKILGYCDQTQKELNPFALEYLGSEEEFDFTGVSAFVGIGNNGVRKKVMEKLNGKVEFDLAIHLSAEIGYGCSVGEGSMLAANAVLNPFVNIAKGVIINTGAIVEHECQISDYAHIAPGAVLAGNVLVGESTFVGARAVIKQGSKVGNNVTIGAGAVIISDVPDNAVIVGNPGKIIKYNS